MPWTANHALPVVTHSPNIGRLPGDDFFCLRYEVWYASADCAIRTMYRTCSGCLDCDQGRFNLKRHEVGLRRKRSIGSR